MNKLVMNNYVNWVVGIGLLLLVVACGGEETRVEPTPAEVLAVVSPSAVPPTIPLPTITSSPTATPAPPLPPTLPATATATAIPTTEPSPTPGVFKADLGVQLHLHGEDIPALMTHLDQIGFGWVKVQVSWKLHEPRPNEYDDVLFSELDQLVDLAEQRNIKVMFGVAKAPEWSRPTTEMDGPPSDYAEFADFLAYLSGRYAGRVAVYELWNEGNLQREWNGVPLSGADFAQLVAVGAPAIRAADPAAIIISGAPAPTGINDRVGAIDDRVYFEEALAAGLANSVDGFGIHPYGWGNPAESRFADPGPAPSHNNHPSFFYLDTINDYEAILRRNGVDLTQKPMWSTEFGWGSTDQFGAPPVAGAEFMNYVDEAAQGAYTVRAIEIGRERPQMGPMILWNLNFAPTFGTDFSESAYSILRPDGEPRQVYYDLWEMQE